MNDFGKRLKQAIEDRGITAAQLSQLSGVSKGLISYYINGKCIAKQDKIFLLAQALNVNPGWLMTGVEQKKSLPEFANDSNKLMKVLINLQPKDYLLVWEAIDRNYQRMKANGEID